MHDILHCTFVAIMPHSSPRTPPPPPPLKHRSSSTPGGSAPPTPGGGSAPTPPGVRGGAERHLSGVRGGAERHLSGTRGGAEHHLAATVRSVFCVPRRELASHVTELVKVFVEAERREAHSVIDSELVDRLGTSYATIAELVVQLMERQRQVVRLRRENHLLRMAASAK